ncbi:MAG: diaminopimelate dehydrogenase [Clostridia bacterium]|nr:diaminopimelate dehydrogenase [Clostridia bacterium]
MIRIGIVGYGNLGKSVARELKNNSDMILVCIFSRRDKKLFKDEYFFDSYNNIKSYKGKIDVMIMCGGSQKDLPEQSPEVLKDFCIIDSFDTHQKILEHLKKLNKVGTQNKTLGLCSCGWDPGLFSLMRVLFSSFSKNSHFHTFWGDGISEGHSDAIRKIDGVLDARQYTILNKQALNLVRSGKRVNLSPSDKHKRECYVAIKKGAKKDEIEQKIKSMPYYFLDYETNVHFLPQKKLEKEHNKLYHAGVVSGFFDSKSGNESFFEFSLKLDSNPDFTASVLICFSRAVYRLYQEGKVGCLSVFDVPFKYLSPICYEELIKSYL